ncbi:NADH:flavin oxidoreductase / NADH oxidase family protein [Apibacter mensalis]|uniref:NADH:flavin oxidoreductase / NADH oxidase family protein n=1 Tax=Apibacter mensalis TaxID=1586267 RepID=A0A0X3APM5_9FLAO|nr:hypothetical protein [Apibacter mensalis]CVK15828.1 NADH:flavin oxidoreductase / NADH oxidase family protein [Apibacter mensalis]
MRAYLPKQVANYYQRRAQSEVGLIITEGTFVRRMALSNDPNVPIFYNEQVLEG